MKMIKNFHLIKQIQPIFKMITQMIMKMLMKTVMMMRKFKIIKMMILIKTIMKMRKMMMINKNNKMISEFIYKHKFNCILY